MEKVLSARRNLNIGAIVSVSIRREEYRDLNDKDEVQRTAMTEATCWTLDREFLA